MPARAIHTTLPSSQFMALASSCLKDLLPQAVQETICRICQSANVYEPTSQAHTVPAREPRSFPSCCLTSCLCHRHVSRISYRKPFKQPFVVKNSPLSSMNRRIKRTRCQPEPRSCLFCCLTLCLCHRHVSRISFRKPFKQPFVV